jgi:hypothetical protein
LPFFKGNRYPSRYSVMLLVSLAPLVAAGSASVLGKIAKWEKSRGEVPSQRTLYTYGGFALILGLVLFEHLSVPLPLSDMRVPGLYVRLAREPGDFAVLELPPGWRNGARVLGKQDVVITQELWNQTVHGKRLLGGNTSRNPEFKFQYFAEDPTLSRLLALTSAADLPQHTALRAALAARPITEADRSRARAWAAFLNLRYVMVHRDKLPPEAEAALRALLDVRLVAEDGNLALYAVDRVPAPLTFAPGTDAGRMVLAEGWNPPDTDVSQAGEEAEAPAWAERQAVRLLLPLGQGSGQLRLYGWAPVAGQQVVAEVGGRILGEQALGKEPGWIEFAFPADPGRPALSEVQLRFARMAPAWSVHGSAAATGAPFALPANLLVRSAGAETGDFAHIYVDGQDLSPNQRGYNLLAHSPEPGTVSRGWQSWEAASFDTHLDPSASSRLAAWVAALPSGTVVVGAVRDEASMNLKPEAVEALRTLGVATDRKSVV